MTEKIEEYNGVLKNYKIVQEGVEFCDEKGEKNGVFALGETIEMPEECGNDFVKNGWAVEVKSGVCPVDPAELSQCDSCQ